MKCSTFICRHSSGFGSVFSDVSCYFMFDKFWNCRQFAFGCDFCSSVCILFLFSPSALARDEVIFNWIYLLINFILIVLHKFIRFYFYSFFISLCFCFRFNTERSIRLFFLSIYLLFNLSVHHFVCLFIYLPLIYLFFDFLIYFFFFKLTWYLFLLLKSSRTPQLQFSRSLFSNLSDFSHFNSLSSPLTCCLLVWIFAHFVFVFHSPNCSKCD